MIVFYGDCVLKEINYVAAGTFLFKHDRVFDVLKKIKKQNGPAQYQDKKEVVRVLQEAVQMGANISNQEKHKGDEIVGKHRIFK